MQWCQLVTYPQKHIYPSLHIHHTTLKNPKITLTPTYPPANHPKTHKFSRAVPARKYTTNTTQKSPKTHRNTTNDHHRRPAPPPRPIQPKWEIKRPPPYFPLNRQPKTISAEHTLTRWGYPPNTNYFQYPLKPLDYHPRLIFSFHFIRPSPPHPNSPLSPPSEKQPKFALPDSDDTSPTNGPLSLQPSFLLS